MKLPDWETLSSEYVVEDPPWMVLRRDMVRRRSGFEHRYWLIEQGPWVQVLAVTSDDRLVLVRQYRYGIKLESLELPGGFGEDDEPLVAAQRELREETGYGGGEWELLVRLSPNPAVLDNWMYCYLARGVERVADPEPEESEELHVELRGADEIPGLIVRGEIVHALHVASLLTYLAR